MDTEARERWAEVEQLLDRALDVAPDRRASFMEHCQGAPELRAEVERLLRATEAAGDFLAEPGPVYASLLVAWASACEALNPGSRLGGYEVKRRVGRGGMATVYLAEDLKHHRSVAIKVLHPELSVALGPDRFLREIEIAARLHHPHILPLHDSGAANGLLYFVMPYVEGESLRQRLARDARLPIDDAIRIAQEVAGALDYAHRQGVVHRDIKPENILLQDGQAIVADFGIARAIGSAGGDRPTEPGSGVGTPAYMSPEQASSDTTVDGRADIYALGCVLYEMLAGQPPFTGRSAQQILTGHAVDPVPSLSTVRQHVPSTVERALERALAKRPADRFATAAEFGRVVGTRRRARSRTWAIGLGLLLLGAAMATLLLPHRPAEIRLGRRTPLTLDPGLEIDPAVSPDGRFVAYAAGPLAGPRIYVRPLGGGTPIPLAPGLGTPQRFPSWSPGGDRILLRSPRGLEVVPALGGAPTLVVGEQSLGEHTAVPASWGRSAAVLPGAWSPDGRQFAYVRSDSLLVTTLAGASSRLVAIGKESHSVAWSSDGRWLAYVNGNRQSLEPGFHFGNVGESTIWVVPAAGGDPVLVTDYRTSSTSPTWLAGGQELLFISNLDGGRDIYRMRLSKSGLPAAPPSRLTTGLNPQAISLSADSRRLVYSVFGETSNIWSLPIPIGAPGSVSQARAATAGKQVIEGFDVSPGGRWLAFDTDRSGNPDIYRIPLAGGEAERLTTDPGNDFGPLWAPGGQEIAFHAFRNGVRQVFVMSADGSRRVQVTRSSGDERSPVWTRDGQGILFIHNFGRSDSDVRLVSRNRAGQWGEPRAILRGNVLQLAVSPDGRQLAFSSHRGLTLTNSMGDSSRILVPVIDAARQLRPSYVCWSADGREIYYLALDPMDRASIWAVPRIGGTPRLLVRFDDPGREWHRFGFRAREGKLYFILGDRQSDLWTSDLESVE